MEASTIQNDIIKNEGNTVVLASPGSGKTFVISEKIKKLLGDDSMLNYQGVIAISYTRKASSNLRQKSLAGGVWRKNSFFGTIDSFCLTQIVLPFGVFVMGYPNKDIVSVAYSELPDEQKEDFEWLINGHPPYDDIKDSTWVLFYELFIGGKVLIESLELIALHILRLCPACRKYIRARYKYIFIDEYQDADEYTNGVFRELIGLGIIGNVVGDSNQSIFGFAHKSSRYLILLEQDPSFKAFRLSNNYRCSAPIINYSNRLIDRNCALLETDEDGVELITITGAEDAVAKHIDTFLEKDCKKFKVTDMSQVAILVKNKKTQELINRSLVAPHRVIESTDLDADLNPRSRLYGMLLQFYFDPTMRFMSITDEFMDYEILTGSERKRLKALKEGIRSVAMEEMKDNLPKLFKQVGDILLSNIDEGYAFSHLQNVLADRSLLDTYKPITGDEVLIMTLHKAKGLEFDMVYHLNLNQWELPFMKVENGDFDNPLYPNWDQDLDLHYVGVTRAKKACFLITSTQRHNSSGQMKGAHPSEFLQLNGVEELRKDYTY